MDNIHKQILKKIKEFDTIVIARHIGPDPDAITSEVALRDIIKLNFPKKKVYAIGSGVSKFKCFGILDKISEDVSFNDALLIILDVPRFDRVDGPKKEEFKYTIKIDHHPCEEGVTDLELVDDTAASCTQMITDFVFDTKLKINKEIAENLYAGIVADSDRFLLSYTSPKTLYLAAMLMEKYKIDIMSVYNKLYERPIKERKFESFLISNLKVSKNGFGYIKITNSLIKEFDVDSSTASNMINDLNFIKELKCWAFSSYDDNSKIYKINIRSRNIPINQVAEKFNGGGHKFASGARLKDEESVDALFEALDNECEKYRDE
ncbi:MAG: bifunctional oligoribonuclease/PAP phosphatase NrnA [Bacilli bacterium]|nr:bifunctional oligoribonuclease/PAP phosphatase NrnA [Bacilli bacterium]